MTYSRHHNNLTLICLPTKAKEIFVYTERERERERDRERERERERDREREREREIDAYMNKRCPFL